VRSSRVAVLSTQYGKASWPFKDPDEIFDFDIDWTQRRFSEEEQAPFNAGRDVDPDDAIATSVFSLPAGWPVAISSSYTGTATKVWLSGGAEYQTYLIQNRITTVGGRTMDQAVKLRCGRNRRGEKGRRDAPAYRVEMLT
jgi:hypothetical protein